MTATDAAEKSDFDIVYHVDSCYKKLYGQAYPIQISHEEFCNILLKNAEHLDRIDNKPAQSASYKVNQQI